VVLQHDLAHGGLEKHEGELEGGAALKHEGQRHARRGHAACRARSGHSAACIPPPRAFPPPRHPAVTTDLLA
jgi:hypothetical protein